MSRNVHKEDKSIITFPQDAIQEDRGLKTCGTPQLVLADISDVVSYKNDRTPIAYKFDTMTIELESSNGTVTAAAGIAVSFPHQPDAKGFVIDWRQVVDGSGELLQDCYRVRVNWTLSGNSGWFYHGSYQLREYSVFNAKGTTRLYVVLNDLVRKQGINYKDSGFAGTVRFQGIFGFMQPNYDTENNTHTNRERYKVRNEAIRTYELRTSYLLRCQTRLIDEETLLAANQIYVTDHNAANHDQCYYDFPVILSEDESPSFEYPVGSVYAKITAKFLDKVAYHESKYDGNIAGSENVILQLPTAVASCPPSTYTVEYENGDLIQNGTIVSGGSDTIEVTNPTFKLVDFDTLDFDNPFGNTDRRTDLVGTQVYTDGIFIDWITFKDGTVNGFPVAVLPSPDVYTNKSDAETYCSVFTQAGFTGWVMSDRWDFFFLQKPQLDAFNYSPINLTGGQIFWADDEITATESLVSRIDIFNFFTAVNTLATGKPLPKRVFTVTGTVLS